MSLAIAREVIVTPLNLNRRHRSGARVAAEIYHHGLGSVATHGAVFGFLHSNRTPPTAKQAGPTEIPR